MQSEPETDSLCTCTVHLPPHTATCNLHLPLHSLCRHCSHSAYAYLSPTPSLFDDLAFDLQAAELPLSTENSAEGRGFLDAIELRELAVRRR